MDGPPSQVGTGCNETTRYRNVSGTGAMLPRNRRAPIHQLSLVVLLLSWLPVGTIVSAQQPQPPAQPSAGTSSNASSIHVTAHLVQVNVIVNGKHGKPITGLTQKDFSVFDNGKRQEIRAFSTETNLPSARYLHQPAGGANQHPGQRHGDSSRRAQHRGGVGALRITKELSKTASVILILGPPARRLWEPSLPNCTFDSIIATVLVCVNPTNTG